MNAQQENKVSMYYKLNVFFANNDTPLIAAIPILESYLEQFRERLEDLQDYEVEATEAITGYAIDKQNLRNAMSNNALVVSGGYVTYYLSQNNNAYANKGRLNKSLLDSMRDTEILYKCEKLVRLCTPYDGNLEDYGVTNAKVTALATAVENYRQFLDMPADERGESKGFGEMVERVIDAIDNLLALIDGVMETVQNSLPVLYLNYKNNRLIDDNASGGGTPPDVEVTIAPGTFQNVFTTPYLASRYFKAKNLGADAISWGLSTSDVAFTNPQRLLNPGSISTLLSTTLGPDGDIVLFQNTSANPISIELTVLE